MAVAPGKFVLYSRIEPPLTAGDYRLTAQQSLTASGPGGALGASQLPVDSLATHLRVRSPRYQLPPDQVLSTFPPANSQGSYGMRLPQIVIRRRTLPWERALGGGAPSGTPWLALVLIAEGEAELKTNQNVAECVTPGVTLTGVADSEKGNYLLVRQSVINRIFPTRLDVPLLAHAREVDINDTELMMGDDDGFLAVVITNRLPLPGRDADGNEVPVKYLACLINLEGQFNALLPRAPEPVITVAFPLVEATVMANTAQWDRMGMGMAPVSTTAPTTSLTHALPGTSVTGRVSGTTSGTTPFTRASEWSAPDLTATTDVYAEMARPFSRTDLRTRFDDVQLLDPWFRFPVLLHWSFESIGDRTFRTLMEGLDSGLLGTTGEGLREKTAGRPALEVVETGHVGLTQRTRRGDEVRAWYRGPFVPHPTEDPPEGRLPLAHAADQVRVIVPDGREDLSLSSAFEIGRLLALSRPSMIAALLRWRQLHYQTARREALWESLTDFLGSLEVDLAQVTPLLGIDLGRSLTRAIVQQPDVFLGDPRSLVDAGRPLDVATSAIRTLAAGFALPERLFRGSPDTVINQLRVAEVPLRDPILRVSAATTTLRQTLVSTLDRQLISLVDDTMAPLRTLSTDISGPVMKRSKRAPAPDALDRLLDALEEEEDAE
ncbi:MAG: hypothetical protein WEE89_07065 [Gemmatimonadota bacterium]